MKVLVVKTSSMGDIIHTLPAITDASRIYPNIEFTWVVEESLTEIPLWHPAVKKIIPIALRRWRKQPLQAIKSGEVRRFIQQLRSEKYDRIIDAQGLLKSALVTYLARGTRCGLDWQSAWEPIASLAYQRRVTVAPAQHAVKRVRELFSRSLDYTLPSSAPNYGIVANQFETITAGQEQKYVVFIHGTAWASKQWPETHWQALAEIAKTAGYQVYLPWGNTEEHERALRIADSHEHVIVLPKLRLQELAVLLKNARGAVAVDTGLGHLAAALSVPTVSLYGPTDPKEVGTVGEKQQHYAMDFSCAPCWQTICHYKGDVTLQPACFSRVAPKQVWESLLQIMQ